MFDFLDDMAALSVLPLIFLVAFIIILVYVISSYLTMGEKDDE